MANNNANIEWKVAVSDMMTLHEPGPFSQVQNWLISFVSAVCVQVWIFFKKIWSMVVSDPRKAIHSLKVGLALSVVSLFYYVRPLYDGIGGSGIGAVMTVAVVFDFTVGRSIILHLQFVILNKIFLNDR